MKCRSHAYWKKLIQKEHTMLPRLLTPLFALLSFVLPGSPSAAAATLNVPSQYATIQAAINASQNGDTVLVADGTYTGPGNVDIDFGGKNLTVTSQHGAASTIINCGGSSSANHRGFYLHSGETSAIVSGLTIQNGYESGGSGDSSGGGVDIVGSSSVTLTYCVVTNNFASGLGGGISNGGKLSLSNCFITGNAASYGGGGICNGATMIVVNCVFTGNSTRGRGGPIYNFFGGTLALTNCTITGNTGGTAADKGGITLVNDIFYGDTGGEVGAGSAAASYCDIQGGYPGTGDINADPLFVGSPADLHLQRGSPCLGAGTASGAPATTIDGQTRSTPPSIGAYEGTVTGNNATTTTLTSSINPSISGQSVTFAASVSKSTAGANPTGTVSFVVDQVTHTPVPLSNGYYASYTTSALTAGRHTVTAVYNGDASYAPSISQSLTQVVSGATTSVALASSLNPSAYAQQVSFAATVTGRGPTGTVTFTDMTANTTLGTATLFGSATSATATATFSTSSLTVGSHQIIASYPGDTSNNSSTSAVISQTVTKASTTVYLLSSINPSISGQSVTFTATVSTSQGAPTGTLAFTVDGTVLSTVAVNPAVQQTYSTSALTVGTHQVIVVYSGDSNFASSTSPALTQTVDAHVSPQYVSPNGSDSNSGTQAAPKLTIQAAINATLSGDTVIVEDGTYTGPSDVDLDFGGRNILVTSQNGAALTIIDCGGTSSVSHRGFNLHYGETNAVINGLTVKNGYEVSSGGGIFVGNGSMLTVSNCVVTNSSAYYGGGLYSSGSLTVDNCLFESNSAFYGGGACNDNGGASAFTNCTFTGNSSNITSGGGGVCGFGGSVLLSNTVLFGDTGGNEIENAYGLNEVTASYCDIQGNYVGTGNINADPLFFSATDLHLQSGSPCLGTGTASGAPAMAIDGKTRPNPPSIGAYEAEQTSTTTTLASSLNPSAAGQSVTFTATVTGTSGTPTGTVVFTLDGAAQTPVMLSAGQAALSTASLAAGSHVITATYGGDQFNAASVSAALTQTVNANSSSLINDTDGGLVYAGSGWGYYPSRGAGDVQDDVHATANNGDSVSYTFTGTSVSFITETAADEGSVQVYLDGVLQVTVNAYSPTRKSQQTLWSKSGLMSGTHTLKLVKQDGGYLLLDALQVSPALPAAAFVNDTSGSLAYTGSGWGYYASRGVGDYQDDVHATANNGDAVSYPFTGTSVSFITETAADEGNVQVYLDGILQTTVNAYSDTRKSQQALWSKTGLAAGSHTLKLVKQDGGYMLLDAFQASSAPPTAGTINDTDGSINYGGSGWGYYPSRGIGDVQNDVHATTNNGDFVSYTFTGTAISYITETAADEGGVSVYLDGTLTQTVNCSAPSRSVQQSVYSLSGLPSGSHTIKLVKTSGDYMLLDAFKFQ